MKLRLWQGWIWVGCALGALILGAGGRFVYQRYGPTSPAVLAPVPTASTQAFFAASLPSLDGQPQSLAAYAGRWVIVNFWATWCPPCVAEMPELDQFYQQLDKNKVVLLGVAIDSPSNVRTFLTQTPVTYPILLGGLQGTELAASLGNQTGGLPFTALLNPRGEIVWRHTGRITLADLQQAVAPARGQ
ncbi:TlpA family protein disulfide reductase [Parvibium lacunae]|uniref:TlpA family protein disulfide reductase n=1 Tax=Parvibium lacunae TaxID=1888893 RepID=UPI001EFEB1F0|nr:TlpA disulfide reductase family protein [Parvibium lacunae]